MKQWLKQYSPSIIAGVIAVAVIVCKAPIIAWFGEHCVRPAYRGEGFSFYVRLFEGRDYLPLSYYMDKMTFMIERLMPPLLVMMVIVVSLVSLPIKVLRKRSLLLIVLGVLLCAIRIWAMRIRFFDPDEFSYLHIGWLMSEGLLPYRDFFEHHMPLFFWLMKLIVASIPEGSGVLFMARGVMLICSLGMTIAFYYCARLVMKHHQACWAVVLLHTMSIIADKTIEIRPDMLACMLCFCGMIIIMRRRIQDITFRHCLMSGLCMGIALILTQRAFFIIAAFSGAMVLTPLLLMRRTITWATYCLKGVLFFTAVLMPAIIVGGYFYFHQSLKEYMYYTFIFNTVQWYARFWTLKSLYSSFLIDHMFWLLSLIGIIMFLRHRREYSAEKGFRWRVFFIMAGCLLIALFINPVPFRQSYIYAIPFLALFAAPVLMRLLDRLWALRARMQRMVLISFCTVGFLLPLGYAYAMTLSTNTHQIKVMNYIARSTNEADTIFDGAGAYIFRPHAYRYFMLPRMLVNLYKKGELAPRVPEALYETNCGLIILDDFVRTLPKDDVQFLHKKYVLLNNPLSIGLAGKKFLARNLSEQEAPFFLMASGNYSVLRAEPSVRVFIDGNEVGETVFLTQGEHELSVLGAPQGDLEVLFDPKGFRSQYLTTSKDSFLCVE